MAQLRIEDPFEIELNEVKQKLMYVEVSMRGFMNSYIQLSPKQRAQQIQSIQGYLRKMSRFIEQSATQTINNTGTRYSLENFKNSYYSLIARWRKFERQL